VPHQVPQQINLFPPCETVDKNTNINNFPMNTKLQKYFFSLALTPALVLAPASVLSQTSTKTPEVTIGQSTPSKPPAEKRSISRSTVKLPPEPVPLEYLEKKPLTITLGSIELVPVKGKITRVALGSAAVVSTTAVDSNLLLIAEQVGITTLMIWADRVVYSYAVQVVPKDLQAVRSMVDGLTAGIPGISVQQYGSELVVSGTAHKAMLSRLISSLKDLPGVKLNVTEDTGSPYTRSVLFRLHFIEVKKSLIEKIGIEWAKDAQGPVFGAQTIGSDTGIFRDLARQTTEGDGQLSNNPSFLARGSTRGGVFLGLATTIASRINLGISSGDIRVLASPELTAKSGGSAKLQVGGEVPIPIATGLGAVNVVFKPYGVLFSIEPQIDANDVITAKVSTELSQIDPSVTVGGIPGFLNRTTSTEVSLKPGEMVALSGLVLSEMSNAVDRVPGISNVPVFGRLFKSEDFRDRKTELIVLLEPEIISAGDGLAQQLKARGLSNIKDFENTVKEKDKKPETTPKDTKALKDNYYTDPN
jgi:pilus assembly protein CpaC